MTPDEQPAETSSASPPALNLCPKRKKSVVYE